MKIFDKLSRDTTKNNKLIAEFMDFTQAGDFFYPPEEDVQIYDWLNGITSYPSRFLRFHSSWEWLMPVVEKIKDIELRTPTRDCNIDKIDEVLTCDLRIDNLYDAVVEFITWYNENK